MKLIRTHVMMAAWTVGIGLAAGPVAAADTASLSGYAYSCSDEAPLAYATVYLASPTYSRIVHADRDGRFIALGLEPGRYTVALHDIGLDLRAMEEPLSPRLPPHVTAHVKLSASRSVQLVPNDNVATRIGVGAELHPQPMKNASVSVLQCDPDTIPVRPDPILRTTVTSAR